MKNTLLYVYLLISIFSCKKRDMIDSDAYDAFAYAYWKKVAEVDEKGNETRVTDQNQLFIRTWSGWTLTQPARGLDSVYFQKDNKIIFKDRVAKTDKVGGSNHLYLLTDRGLPIEMKFEFPDQTNDSVYVYVSKIQNDRVVKGYLDKYIFVKPAGL